MFIKHGKRITVFPDRLSFGFVGHLDRLFIGPQTIKLFLTGLVLTDDWFDPAKLALSGHTSISALLREYHWATAAILNTLYIGAETRDGGIRVCYTEKERSCLMVNEVIPEVLAEHLGIAHLDGHMLRGKVAVPSMALAIERHYWEPFFMWGDKEWHSAIARFAENFKTWNKKTSILKRTLCRRTC